ncbi:hypothetical protein Tco_0538615 [Tanacetum coccineum]
MASKIKNAERVSTVRERIKTEERIKIVWRSRYYGGDLSRRYSTSVTKTKAATYELKWIKDLVPNCGLIPINRGLIQAIPISLPLQLTGEAKKASTFKAFTWVSRRFHTLLTFVFRIVQNESCGSWDRPTMLATDDMHQWRSRFLQYIDTRPNGDALRKCILKGPYTPTIVTTPAVPATEDSPAVPEQTTVETVMNMTPKTELHLNQKKEAIICMTGIGDVIYHMLMHVRTAQGNVGKPSKGSNKVIHLIFKMSDKLILGSLVKSPLTHGRNNCSMIMTVIL